MVIRRKDNGMIGLLIPIGIMRFAIIAPFGFYWAIATNHETVINNFPLLHNGTFDPSIVTGERMAAKWGSLAFFWNFAVWLPAIWIMPPLSLPFVCVDALVAITLSITTHYQTSYNPRNKNECDLDVNPDIYDFGRPPGMNESFFQAAARLNGTVTTPEKMCETFVVEWQYGVALSFFYSFISLLGFITVIGAIREARREGKSLKSQIEATAKSLFKFINNIPKAFLLLMVGILYWLPEFFFRCLPTAVKKPVRLGRRHVVKAGLGAEQQVELKMHDMKVVVKKKFKTQRRFQGGEGNPTPLAEFLGIYDMLMLVTHELHYIDMKSLCCVSKSVRQAVLPADDFDRRIGVFRIHTCRYNPKILCWTCQNQLCKDCCQNPQVRQTTLIHHLESCKPYCSSCYHQHVVGVGVRPPRTDRLKTPFCTCAPVHAKPNIFRLYINGAAYYRSRQHSLPSRTRQVCRACNVLSADELLDKLEERIKRDLKQGHKADDGKKWTTCARNGCLAPLGTGPRWWVCDRSGCGKECGSVVHGAWGRGVKGEGVAGDVV